MAYEQYALNRKRPYRVHVYLNEQEYQRLNINRIGNNINQIAAKQHSHGFVDEPMLREAVASLQRMEREFTRAFAQES